ncbi:MAG: hypothetical protein COV72_00370 [Candidatus Omnitrophica bacterium CG11_big_fil_rev_8_21_14_0_20_42_13]|uniref:Type II secretion system protein GspE N-terminal domain-containing protein n=1 Tax=Candidatus Ghiorseimicrobium undicola TaxID=1974746 RepID=A0A2H0LZY6_9BACT|nr:MAG: hypothetical protein COV72_00370 [Candidatus Omnitrophica bacterium CG11_big_fil_rev_8_21_14_0_20_42_13]
MAKTNTYLRRKSSEYLGSLLIRNRIIDYTQLDKAIRTQNNTSPRKLLGEIMLELGFAGEDDLTTAFMSQYHLPYIPLNRFQIHSEAVKLIPPEIIHEHTIMPFQKIGSILSIAIGKPIDNGTIEKIEEMSGHVIQLFLSNLSEIKENISRYYLPNKEIISKTVSSINEYFDSIVPESLS